MISSEQRIVNKITASTLLSQYQKTRAYSVELCAPLGIEDYIPQPVDFASPPKWHLSHITWFFEEMVLKKYQPTYKIFNKDFSFLFNSYYQTVGERAIRSERGAITRPYVSEVYAYRNYVDQHIEKLLQTACTPEIAALITLGIHHEQQHQELLLTDLKHTFSLNPLHPVYKADYDLTKDQNQSRDWVKMNEGIYTIGHQGEGFCFDNELGKHQVFLHDYSISKGLVTNGDYIKFWIRQIS